MRPCLLWIRVSHAFCDALICCHCSTLPHAAGTLVHDCVTAEEKVQQMDTATIAVLQHMNFFIIGDDKLTMICASVLLGCIDMHCAHAICTVLACNTVLFIRVSCTDCGACNGRVRSVRAQCCSVRNSVIHSDRAAIHCTTHPSIHCSIFTLSNCRHVSLDTHAQHRSLAHAMAQSVICQQAHTTNTATTASSFATSCTRNISRTTNSNNPAHTLTHTNTNHIVHVRPWALCRLRKRQLHGSTNTNTRRSPNFIEHHTDRFELYEKHRTE